MEKKMPGSEITEFEIDLSIDASWSSRPDNDASILEHLVADLIRRVPEVVEVQRERGGLLGRRNGIRRVVVNCENETLTLERAGNGVLAYRYRSIQGMRLRCQMVSLNEFMAAVDAHLALQAAQAAARKPAERKPLAS